MSAKVAAVPVYRVFSCLCISLQLLDTNFVVALTATCTIQYLAFETQDSGIVISVLMILVTLKCHFFKGLNLGIS